jgi:hypothetical protein
VGEMIECVCVCVCVCVCERERGMGGYRELERYIERDVTRDRGVKWEGRGGE